MNAETSATVYAGWTILWLLLALAVIVVVAVVAGHIGDALDRRRRRAEHNLRIARLRAEADRLGLISANHRAAYLSFRRSGFSQRDADALTRLTERAS